MFSNLPISTRFAVSIALTLLAVGLVLLLVVLGQMKAVTERAEARQLEDLHHTLQSDIANASQHAVMTVSAIISAEGVSEAFARRDRERLQALTLPVFETLEREHHIRQFQFHTPPATSFLRLHLTERFGDDLSSFRRTVVAANTTQQPQLGLETGVAGMGLRGVVPVFYQRRHVGSAEIGLSFGQEFFDTFTQQYNAPTALHHQTREQELQREPGLQIFATTIPGGTTLTPRQIAAAMSGQSVSAHTRIDGRDWAVLAKAVPDFSGQPAAVAEILIDRSDYVLGQRATILRVVIIGALTLVIGLLVAWLVSRSISRPIEQLTRAADSISRGEFAAEIVGVDRKDEVGELARAIRRLAASIQVAMERMRKGSASSR